MTFGYKQDKSASLTELWVIEQKWGKNNLTDGKKTT